MAAERLGIAGYPPERSIYESVLAASGMHIQKDGVWAFRPPSQNAETNLYPVWHYLDGLVFEKREQPLNLKDLYSELEKPPYGVLGGLMPILLAAFYVLNRDEVSLYNEGTFLPEPQESHFELMVRRPELFAISGMRIKGNRQRIVERLAIGLNTEPKVLAVVRRLYAAMNSLTKYARETNSIPADVQSFRRVFFDAKSPERLLFSELPKAFGIGEISENGRDDAVFDSYFKALNECLSVLGAALPKLIAENRKLLLESCGFENSATGWQMLYDKASFLLARTGGSDIVPFLQNIVNSTGDWGKADQVMSYIQQAPMDKWGTLHINEFKRNVIGISERFLAACRPFDHIPAALSRKDREEADILSRDISKQLSSGKASVAIRRAALLACLDSLDGEGKN